mmetsp:Transcript_43182/g.122330  ORF Transcript_43182/g.122330 Transcript_43182/m.122330 type:complete len:363 (+) Transcript_43182:1135-2223(+)
MQHCEDRQYVVLKHPHLTRHPPHSATPHFCLDEVQEFGHHAHTKLAHLTDTLEDVVSVSEVGGEELLQRADTLQQQTALIHIFQWVRHGIPSLFECLAHTADRGLVDRREVEQRSVARQTHQPLGRNAKQVDQHSHHTVDGRCCEALCSSRWAAARGVFVGSRGEVECLGLPGLLGDGCGSEDLVQLGHDELLVVVHPVVQHAHTITITSVFPLGLLLFSLGVALLLCQRLSLLILALEVQIDVPTLPTGRICFIVIITNGRVRLAEVGLQVREHVGKGPLCRTLLLLLLLLRQDVELLPHIQVSVLVHQSDLAEAHLTQKRLVLLCLQGATHTAHTRADVRSEARRDLLPEDDVRYHHTTT